MVRLEGVPMRRHSRLPGGSCVVFCRILSGSLCLRHEGLCLTGCVWFEDAAGGLGGWDRHIYRSGGLWVGGLISVVRLLDLGPSACHRLELLDLQDATPIDRLDVLAMALAVLLELLVDVQEQLLYLRTGHHVLLVEARADAEMQGLLGLLLLGALLEA